MVDGYYRADAGRHLHIGIPDGFAIAPRSVFGDRKFHERVIHAGADFHHVAICVRILGDLGTRADELCGDGGFGR
jgi:hypothetical protein